MAGPGQGRYTKYLPENTGKSQRLNSLFNSKATNSMGVFYGSVDASNTDAAKVASTNALKFLKAGVGDPSMFPTGVDMTYGAAPNITDVKWKNAGDPANPWVPDLSSPGPSGGESVNVDPKSKDKDPGLSAADVKPDYVPGTPQSFGNTSGTGTVSPSATSTVLGTTSIGADLTPGKSAV